MNSLIEKLLARPILIFIRQPGRTHRRWLPWILTIGLVLIAYLWVVFGPLGNEYGIGHQKTIFYQTDFVDGGWITFFSKWNLLWASFILAIPSFVIATILVGYFNRFFTQRLQIADKNAYKATFYVLRYVFFSYFIILFAINSVITWEYQFSVNFPFFGLLIPGAVITLTNYLEEMASRSLSLIASTCMVVFSIVFTVGIFLGILFLVLISARFS